MRRKVLGEEQIAAADIHSGGFSDELHAFVVEHCWGNVWIRPGLSLKARSLVTLGTLAGSNRWTEFKVHVQGALRNGVTQEELKEVFLQLGVYAGAPAAVEAFRAAEDILQGSDKSK